MTIILSLSITLRFTSVHAIFYVLDDYPYMMCSGSEQYSRVMYGVYLDRSLVITLYTRVCHGSSSTMQLEFWK